jgi:cytochrome b6-f complex iron-sulfur subunit
MPAMLLPQPPPPETVSVPAAVAKRVSRRDLLSITWKALLALSSALGLAGLWRFLSYQPDPAPPTTFDLGPADAYPPGTRAKITQAQAVLIHTEIGYQALSLICPHLGCTVDFADGGFACPCHGSRFEITGRVKRGPAQKPMRVLKVEVNSSGHLILNTA